MRFFPPVYAPVSAGAMWRAARTLWDPPPFTGSRGEAFPGARFENRTVWLTDSGTSALTLALRVSARACAPRVVALPAYCCPDLATAAVAARYRIRLYDVHPHTLEPDWDSVRQCLAQGASHLVVAHLLGRVINVHEAQRVAAMYGVVVIEDAAQGAGGCMHGVPAGALGDISVLSFGRGKGLNAGGGGALCIRTGVEHAPVPVLPPRGLASALKALAAVLLTEVLSRPLVYAVPARLPFVGLGKTVYHEPTVATQPTTVTRALIGEALANEDALLAQRQAVEAWYQRELGTLDCAVAPVAAGVQSGALRFPVRLDPAAAGALVRYGVVRYYPRTLAEYPEFAAHVEPTPDSLNGAKALAATLHTLPTHNLLRDGDRAALIRALRSTGAMPGDARSSTP